MNAMIMMAHPMGGDFFNSSGNDFVPLASFSSPEEDYAFTRRVSTPSNRDERNRCKTLLPKGFEPTPYSVICGRGRKSTSAVGNRRLQVMAQMFVGKYAQLSRKEDKTEIVSEILRMVQDACPDERFAFVKYHDGRWWEVETLIAREKIGAVLRDCLASKYRSSTKSKLERRREKKQRVEQGSGSVASESERFPSQAGVKSNSSISLADL